MIKSYLTHKGQKLDIQAVKCEVGDWDYWEVHFSQCKEI